MKLVDGDARECVRGRRCRCGCPGCAVSPKVLNSPRVGGSLGGGQIGAAPSDHPAYNAELQKSTRLARLKNVTMVV